MEMPRVDVLLKRTGLQLTEIERRSLDSYQLLKVPKSTFCRWKKAFADQGVAGLLPMKPVGKRWPNQIFAETVEKILELRREYHLGPQRIAWYA